MLDVVVSHWVLVSQWQFQCCGDTPEAGLRVAYRLGSWPESPAWAALRERFARPLVADWHDREPLPVLHGVIVDLHELSFVYRKTPGSRAYEPVPGTERISPVTRACRWPAEPGSPGGRRIAGVIAGIRAQSVTDPDPAAVAAYRIEVELQRRTLHLTGPVTVFGSVPAVGARLTVDVSDPRLSVTGEVRGGPLVAGEAVQVSWALPHPRAMGVTVFVSVDRAAPAGTPVFVRLLQDRSTQ